MPRSFPVTPSSSLRTQASGIEESNRGARGQTYLDITPLGRQETWEDSPEGYPQTPPYKWWNWHDNYDAEASPDRKRVEVSDVGEAAFRKSDAEPKA